MEGTGIFFLKQYNQFKLIVCICIRVHGNILCASMLHFRLLIGKMDFSVIKKRIKFFLTQFKKCRKAIQIIAAAKDRKNSTCRKSGN